MYLDWFKIFLCQFLTAFIVCLPSISGGLTYGFSSILIPQLQHPDSDIRIDLEQGSWIGEPLSCVCLMQESTKMLQSKLKTILTSFLHDPYHILSWTKDPLCSASMFVIGDIIGCALGGILADRYNAPWVAIHTIDK